MPYTVNQSKQYSVDPDTLYQAAKGAMEGLEGKFETEDSESGTLVARFHKTVLGKVLGDRAWVQVIISGSNDGGSNLELTAYPLDAIGNKLMFGARKGALKTLLAWFDAHLNHRLPK